MDLLDTASYPIWRLNQVLFSNPAKYIEENFLGVYNWKEVGTYQNGKIIKLDSNFNATVRNKNVEEHFVTCTRDACEADEIKIPEG